MGNVEYAAAVSELVLPVIRNFQPDLIIVACGLDAAQGDLLGDCGMSPDMYYAITKALLKEAGERTPFVIALEGGYHLDVINKCMEAIALALLDEPYIPLSQRSSVPSDISLEHYWINEDMLNTEGIEVPFVTDETTALALRAIRKSAKALGKTRRFDWIGHPSRSILPESYGCNQIYPLCHRPVQRMYLAPKHPDGYFNPFYYPGTRCPDHDASSEERMSDPEVSDSFMENIPTGTSHSAVSRECYF